MDASFGGKSHEAQDVKGRGREFESFVAPTSEPAENLSWESRQISQSYENTTNYEVQNPVAIRPPDRGGFLRSPCLYKKYPKVKAPLVGGNEIAAEKILSDLARMKRSPKRRWFTTLPVNKF